jgi:hypothetical protein
VSDDLDRFFTSLHRDANDPVLADAAAIRRTGDRRTRHHRVAGAGVACLATVAAVAGATSLAGHGTGGRVPVTPWSSAPASTPASYPPSGPASEPPSTPPSGPPSTPPPRATHACQVADFGRVSAYSDGTMGTMHWVVSLADVGSEPCSLDTGASVWLTDPDTGRDVRLQPDDPHPARLAVRPGQQAVFVLTMGTAGLESANDPSCQHSVLYQTLKVQLADGVRTAQNLGIGFACKGHNDAGPTVGGWSAG